MRISTAVYKDVFEDVFKGILKGMRGPVLLFVLLGALGCAEQESRPNAGPDVSSCGNRISLGITTACRNDAHEVAGLAETWTALGFEYSCPHSRCSEPRQITFHRDGTYASKEYGKGDLSLQDELDFSSAMEKVVEAGLVLNANCEKTEAETDASNRRLVLFVQSKAAADIYWYEPKTSSECHLGKNGSKEAISNLIQVLDRLAAKYD